MVRTKKVQRRSSKWVVRAKVEGLELNLTVILIKFMIIQFKAPGPFILHTTKNAKIIPLQKFPDHMGPRSLLLLHEDGDMYPEDGHYCEFLENKRKISMMPK